MSDTAVLLGTGWVHPLSMGRPGAVHKFESVEDMEHLSGKSVLEIPYKAFGRMDLFSKLGFSAIAFAMADAGFPPVPADKNNRPEKKNISLIAESATGCLETDLHYQATLSRQENRLPSPALFAYTLASCFLGEAGIYHGVSGQAFVIEKESCTGLTALSLAMNTLGENGCEAAVCGICNSGAHLCAGTGAWRPGALFIVIGADDSVAPGRDNTRPCLQRIIRKTDPMESFYSGNKKLHDLTDLIPKEVL
ncbi:beta-ketoacyl synthase N-terminal-like domain-containing protein [uncultured Desulfobacter sp.]|uniref:beta-ketoacyl synthase N-terminal-like domain-containing protein n=1 Tax=uncultured Desulfobacter sp. TaxID=240139 RepID=UPI002AABB9BF|nr:beta-ketoacyl synthase N-terminal-like domain-containing protein [uncultured Desulfobacter sp.]